MSGDVEFVRTPRVWVPGLFHMRRAIYLAGSMAEPDWRDDWREQMVPLIEKAAGLVPGGTGTRYAILSPRRGDVVQPSDYLWDEQRMEWESDHLSRAHRIAFWFDAGDPCEAYFQLRDTLGTRRRMAIGVEPGYPRRRFVRFVVSRLRPDVEIVDNLQALASAVLRAKPRPARRKDR